MSLFPACMAESPTIYPHAPHHFQRNRIFLGFPDILDSYSLPPPVQLNEGWFCWQMLRILHPESLWTPYFLHHRKEINKHMGVILLHYCAERKWWIKAFCSTLSTRSLFLPVTGKYFCLPCIVLLTSIRSTYFLPYISADRAMIWAVFNTLETLLIMLPTGTTLAWHGEESVGCGHLSWESKSSGVSYSPQRVDMTNGLWLGAGVHLMSDSGVTVIYLPPSILTASFCAFSILCCTQDLTQAWVAIGLIEVGLETENLALADTLEFVASKEVLIFDLLCNSVVYLPDPVLVQVHKQSCWIEPATVQIIWGNS